eukprot:3941288-Rhodomonas_salina.1
MEEAQCPLMQVLPVMKTGCVFIGMLTSTQWLSKQGAEVRGQGGVGGLLSMHWAGGNGGCGEEVVNKWIWTWLAPAPFATAPALPGSWPRKWGPVQPSSSLSSLLCLYWGWQPGKRLCCSASPWCGKAGADWGGRRKGTAATPFPNSQMARARTCSRVAASAARLEL